MTSNQSALQLPDLIELSAFGGDWSSYIDHLYSIFERDFVQHRLKFMSMPIVFDTRLHKGKCEGFWHITSSFDEQTNQRNPDLRRCERVPWPKPIVNNSADPLVSIWENIRGKKSNIMIYLESHDYLIVLIKRKNVFVLATAYFINQAHTRKKLKKERNAYLKAKTAP
jgi:hypothetical protein